MLVGAEHHNICSTLIIYKTPARTGNLMISCASGGYGFVMMFIYEYVAALLLFC
jgi:hypothetical protein